MRTADKVSLWGVGSAVIAVLEWVVVKKMRDMSDFARSESVNFRWGTIARWRVDGSVV